MELVRQQEHPAKDFQPLLHAQAGRPANTVQLGDDLRAVQQLYGSRGYVTATIKANAEYDDTAGRLHRACSDRRSRSYRMGELEFPRASTIA